MTSTNAPLFSGKNVFKAGVDFGDRIWAETNGFLIVATVENDQDDGFVSVVLSVARLGVLLDSRAAQRYGIATDDVEGMTRAANELVSEAVYVAVEMIKELCKGL
jgi:phenylalanyl-tRNA synthetase beta subunit